MASRTPLDDLDGSWRRRLPSARRSTSRRASNSGSLTAGGLVMGRTGPARDDAGMTYRILDPDPAHHWWCASA